MWKTGGKTHESWIQIRVIQPKIDFWYFPSWNNMLLKMEYEFDVFCISFLHNMKRSMHILLKPKWRHYWGDREGSDPRSANTWQWLHRQVPKTGLGPILACLLKRSNLKDLTKSANNYTLVGFLFCAVFFFFRNKLKRGLMRWNGKNWDRLAESAERLELSERERPATYFILQIWFK